MATLDPSNAQHLVAMTDPNVVAFGIADVATADLWSYGTPAGTVDRIAVDLGNGEFDNRDSIITRPSRCNRMHDLSLCIA